MTVKDIVKDIVKDNNIARISHCAAGIIYYKVEFEGKNYQFSVDMNDKDDVGTTAFPAEMKAITLMRYIRKAMDKNEFF